MFISTKKFFTSTISLFLCMLYVDHLGAHNIHKRLSLPEDSTVADTVKEYKRTLDIIAGMSIPETQQRRLKALLGALYLDYLETTAIKVDAQKDSGA